MQIDLHGLTPVAALRRLAQELHTARVRGATELLVITGRGMGNAAQKPILRQKVEIWLRSAEGQRAGAGRFEVRNKGGALLVQIGARGR